MASNGWQHEEVRGEVRRIHTVVIDVSAHVSGIETDNDIECLYELRVNGRTLKRMNTWQARRLGILPEQEMR